MFWNFLIFFFKKIQGNQYKCFWALKKKLVSVIIQAHFGEEIWNKFLDIIIYIWQICSWTLKVVLKWDEKAVYLFIEVQFHNY